MWPDVAYCTGKFYVSKNCPFVPTNAFGTLKCPIFKKYIPYRYISYTIQLIKIVIQNQSLNKVGLFEEFTMLKNILQKNKNI